jgi:hypothetical protein
MLLGGVSSNKPITDRINTFLFLLEIIGPDPNPGSIFQTLRDIKFAQGQNFLLSAKGLYAGYWKTVSGTGGPTHLASTQRRYTVGMSASDHWRIISRNASILVLS